MSKLIRFNEEKLFTPEESELLRCYTVFYFLVAKEFEHSSELSVKCLECVIKTTIVKETILEGEPITIIGFASRSHTEIMYEIFKLLSIEQIYKMFYRHKQQYDYEATKEVLEEIESTVYGFMEKINKILEKTK